MQLDRLIKTVIKRPFAKPFLAPVAKLYPGLAQEYEAEIRRPMDLGTLLINVRKGVYNGQIQNGQADLKLIWENCYQFNPPTCAVAKNAEHLQKFCEATIANQPALQRNNHDNDNSSGHLKLRKSQKQGQFNKRKRKKYDHSDTTDRASPKSETEKTLQLAQHRVKHANYYTEKQRPEYWQLVNLAEALGKMASWADHGPFRQAWSIISRSPTGQLVSKQLGSDHEECRTLDLEHLETPVLLKLQMFVSTAEHSRAVARRRRRSQISNAMAVLRADRKRAEQKAMLQAHYDSDLSSDDIDTDAN